MKDLTIALLLVGIGLFALQNHGLRQEFSDSTQMPEAEVSSEAVTEAASVEAVQDIADVVASQTEEIEALEAKLERAKKLINKLGTQYKRVVTENRRLNDVVDQRRADDSTGPVVVGVGTSVTARK